MSTEHKSVKDLKEILDKISLWLKEKREKHKRLESEVKELEKKMETNPSDEEIKKKYENLQKRCQKLQGKISKWERIYRIRCDEYEVKLVAQNCDIIFSDPSEDDEVKMILMEMFKDLENQRGLKFLINLFGTKYFDTELKRNTFGSIFTVVDKHPELFDEVLSFMPNFTIPEESDPKFKQIISDGVDECERIITSIKNCLESIMMTETFRFWIFDTELFCYDLNPDELLITLIDVNSTSFSKYPAFESDNPTSLSVGYKSLCDDKVLDCETEYALRATYIDPGYGDCYILNEFSIIGFDEHHNAVFDGCEIVVTNAKYAENHNRKDTSRTRYFNKYTYLY